VERIDVFAYRNTRVLPRVFWAERVVVVPDENHMRSEILRGDLSGVAVVEGTGPTSGFSQGSTSDQAKVVEAADGYLTVEAESQTSRFLVISEIWHPGWRALLDGRPLPIVRADLALMGAWLPAGRHRLVLEFRPLHWRTALRISAFSACAFLALLVVHFVRLREPRAGVP
jgi:hypothetical protein